MMRRFARRPLLIISSLCVCLGMSLLGYATYANDQEDAEDTGFVRDYLPLISVLFIAVSYQLGLGPVGWSYLCKTNLQTSWSKRVGNVVFFSTVLGKDDDMFNFFAP